MRLVRVLVPAAALVCILVTSAFGQQGDADQAARSIALFREAGKVLQHPRCLNCHPASDHPSQTDAMRPHNPRVMRAWAESGAYCPPD
jgi:hypothetical protein